MKKIIIYTDGSCSGNPGPGGWAAILKFGDVTKELSGCEHNTTNNRMEILGAIKGLEALKYQCEVEIVSDSAYLVNAHTQGWLTKWQSQCWMKKEGNKFVPVQNKDLWERLIALEKHHVVHFVKTNGHADDKMNNRADTLARCATAAAKFAQA